MHTYVIKDGIPGDELDIRIHHNSDWSGMATFHWHGSHDKPNAGSVNIPGGVAKLLCQVQGIEPCVAED